MNAVNTKALIKKIVLGGYAKADISGRDDWVVGVVISVSDKTITFDPKDGTDPVTVPFSIIKQATKAEFEAQLKQLKRSPLAAVSEQAITKKAGKVIVEGDEEPPLRIPKKVKKVVANPAISHEELSEHIQAGILEGVAKESGKKIPPKVKAIVDKVAKKAPIKSAEDSIARGGIKEAPPVAEVKQKIVAPDFSRYTVHEGVKTKSGRNAVDTNDAVANLLRGCTLEECYAMTVIYLKAMRIYTVSRRKTPVEIEDLKLSYNKLNPGMQRMNLGNLLRNGMATIGIAKLPKIK